ncbi:hypothetical protein Tco_0684550 [Tanacetum coccineum]
MLKWSFELEAFDISYRPRTSIQGQVLADFIAEKPDEDGPPVEVHTLSKIASTSFTYLTKQVLVEVLKKKSIEEKEILMVVEEEGHSWMTPLLEYLADDTLPAEAKRAHAIKIKSRQYVVIDGVLYRKSFLEPWL